MARRATRTAGGADSTASVRNAPARSHHKPESTITNSRRQRLRAAGRGGQRRFDQDHATRAGHARRASPLQVGTLAEQPPVLAVGRPGREAPFIPASMHHHTHVLSGISWQRGHCGEGGPLTTAGSALFLSAATTPVTIPVIFATAETLCPGPGGGWFDVQNVPSRAWHPASAGPTSPPPDHPLCCSCWPTPCSGSSTSAGITVSASPASSCCGI